MRVSSRKKIFETDILERENAWDYLKQFVRK